MPRRKQVLGSADEIEAAFYDALHRADIEALMALWADDEEIACVHPGAPRLIGHAAIRASWENIFEGGGVQVNPIQIHTIQNLMTVVHHVVEETQQAREGRGGRDMHILATNIYVKTPHGWRIAVHHASLAPGAAPRELPLSAILH